MKRIILIIVGLILLGAVGYLGYEYFLNGRTPIQVFQQHERGIVEEKKKDIDLTYYYIKIPPLTVSVIRNDRIVRIYTIQLIIEVKNEQAKLEVEQKLPFLTNDFLTYLHTIAALPMIDDVANVPFVKARLKKIAEKIVGKDRVNSILIQATFDRAVK
jgi:flagellar basal body-associated protein FliL